MNPEQSTRASFGGSSRDEEPGSKGQRRTASSSGFLVDSFRPRSKTVRTSGPQPSRSDTDHRKREAPEALTTPPKRSRFRWHRHKGSGFAKESDDISQDVGDEKRDHESPHQAGDAPAPESHGTGSSRRTGSGAENRGDQPDLGLDKDSLQIVNLALNLSESRKKGNPEYHASNQIAGGSWASSSDGRASAAGSVPSHSSFTGHPTTHSTRNEHVKFARPPVPTMTNDVLNSLPKSATSDPVPQGFSGGTLARAANARRYFELRLEYLRLLPSLPPLYSHENHSANDNLQYGDSQYQSNRVYNPLQAIRNRKVRFRERCPIDPEAAGWNDVEKVHNWVDSIETGYRGQARTPLECLKLPMFHGRNYDAPLDEGIADGDAPAASPPSSLRRVSRTGSMKARRPMSDWLIYPDELLADAAWVEDAQNKSRLINKDGNILYPNSSALFVNNAYQEQEEQAEARSSIGTGRASSHAPRSESRQSPSVGMKDVSRGRQPRNIRSPYSAGRSSSASDEDPGSKRRKFRIRSPSSSSADERPSRDFLSNIRSPGKSVSPKRRKRPNWIEKRESLSSGPSADERYDPLSLAKMEGHAPPTGMDIGFPSIASNLSPPSSRSSSPAKRGFTRAVGHRRGQSRNEIHRKGGDDDSSVDYEPAHKDSAPSQDPISQQETEAPSLPAKASTYHLDGRRMNPHDRKDSIPHESKLKGIFKGPGKIAGKVGNEVSKMGDFILKKDSAGHSRQSSLAISDDSDLDDEEVKSEKRGLPKAILRRLPTFTDDPGRASPRTSDKSLVKNHSQTPPTIVEPGDENDSAPGHLTSSQGRLLDLQGDASTPSGSHQSKSPGRSMKHAPKFLHFGPEIHTIRDEFRRGRIKDNSVPYSMARPPVTGLANAQPTPVSSSNDMRPTLSNQTRSWSISDRSVSVSIESGVPGKQEIERTRALLLSSGIKAREITRRAETVRSPPPEFLQRSFGPDGSIPSVPRLYEHELASRRLLKRIEASHSSFETSIERVPKAAFSPLKSQLSTLEDLVNKSLNTRVRAAAEEAENLSMQLNTTSTLAVKQLSDTLEHGLRKRHRRLRWLRRTGFMMLEWALIGLLWWVWLIVVAFRLLRKVLRGMGTGVRWIL